MFKSLKSLKHFLLGVCKYTYRDLIGHNTFVISKVSDWFMLYGYITMHCQQNSKYDAKCLDVFKISAT